MVKIIAFFANNLILFNFIYETIRNVEKMGKIIDITKNNILVFSKNIYFRLSVR
jgi:hypothetical protein